MADLWFRKGDKLRCFEACEVVLTSMLGQEEAISKEDKDYVRFWMKWLLISSTKYSDSQAMKIAIETNVQYADINTFKVDRSILKLFPVTVSQGRDFDRVFAENLREA